MKLTISSEKLTKLFVLYVLASLVGYFTASFTIAAWLVYSFVLLPFYVICILYLLNFDRSHHPTVVEYRCSPLFFSVVLQILTILTSPADCHGWNQGAVCYSFIQIYVGNSSARFQDTSAHWGLIELMFPIVLLLYLFSVGVFLGTLYAGNSSARFQDTSAHWGLIELMFPIVLLLYLFSVGVFLGTLCANTGERK